MGMIIEPDGTRTEVRPKNGKNYKLEEMQKIVGGLVEIVQLTKGVIMVVNEEGLLVSLLFNVVASNMYQAFLNTPGHIVGTVLVCKDEEVK